MGGDDLGSDDEYLTGPIVSAAATGLASDDSSVDDNGSVISFDPKLESKGRKRSRDHDDVKTTKDDVKETSTKKSKSKGGPMGVLGERIRLESVESTAEILTNFADVQFQPQHIARGPQKGRSDHHADSNNIMDRLTSLISKKQLKAKLQKKSPRAIVVCISARRAVAVLKDLAPLKLRVAKLFPKQGTIDDQAKQLETTDFGIAVGTPHRMNELIERGSLTLVGTRLVSLDTFENAKRFSVYTLPDTAPQTKKLLKEYVHPECMRRKDLAVGFL